MKMEIDTTAYEISHGRKPRGAGAWAFEVTPITGPTFVVFAPGESTYSEACRWVRRDIIGPHIARVQVGS